jgi:pyruvate dehydrogenase (quinone)
MLSWGLGVKKRPGAATGFLRPLFIAFDRDARRACTHRHAGSVPKLPVKIVVVKNNSLGMIKWEQMVFLGNPEYGCELEPIDFAAFARACGATGITIDDPAHCGHALDQALATEGPVLVEAVVDPHEPPLPPKVTLEQARHFGEALMRGTPNREKIALTVLSDKVRELL